MPAARSWLAANELAGTIVLNGLVALVSWGCRRLFSIPPQAAGR
jgi:hypothetical protein